eukprot:m.362003 g.362003  ORF g.362003 m.362003 type:complete len:59 (-) comp20034_c0_seq1:1526-1702(-)
MKTTCSTKDFFVVDEDVVVLNKHQINQSTTNKSGENSTDCPLEWFKVATQWPKKPIVL